MGASQSTDNGSSHFSPTTPGGEANTGYYELLGVNIKASEEELKKAYHRKALELHPDRNYGNVEAATIKFADVQSAYEVLSDPQERAWYDSHRDSILRGNDENAAHYEHSIRVTTAEHIMQLFSRFNRRIDFSDSPTGFFGALRGLFDNLIQEEAAACEWDGLDPIPYPSFGYKDDSHEAVVRPFYAAWNGFATKKTFSWKDIYNYSEAPDRQIRRMMEKENKRLRDEGVREFNDAIRSLVAFIRKRDPRFKPSKQSEEERQKILKDAATAQAIRSRAANQAKLMEEAVPDWMMANANETSDLTDDDWREVIPLKEDVECVVCRKTFRSEKQYEAHENSKKHIKAVAQIRRQMQREDKEMNLGGQEKTESLPKPVVADVENSQSRQDMGPLEHPHARFHRIKSEQSAEVATDMNENAQISHDQQVALGGYESDAASNDEYAPREEVEQRLFACENGLEQHSNLQSKIADSAVGTLALKFADESLLDKDEPAKEPKLGKAKERRAKKAAQQSSPSIHLRADFTCATCSEGFSSKNQLFRHIKELGHDHPVQRVTKGNKGKR